MGVIEVPWEEKHKNDKPKMKKGRRIKSKIRKKLIEIIQPNKWYVITDLAKQIGCTYTGVFDIIQIWLKDGKLKRTKFKNPHYKYKIVEGKWLGSSKKKELES